MRLERRIQMAFLDMDLTEQVSGKHELRDISKTINLSTLWYRLKDLESMVGRNGYGVVYVRFIRQRIGTRITV